MLFRKSVLVMAAWLLAWLLVGAAALAFSNKAPSGQKKDELRGEGRFLRLTRTEDGQPMAMETAIVRYAAPNGDDRGLTVDLIAAVHVAEKSYYDDLNREFDSYDAVLYELVAPEGTRIPKGGGGAGGSPVSMLQRGMTDLLKLQFQLQAIDYTKPNLVHADMSPRQFAEAMAKRGESMVAMFTRMMGYAMARQPQQAGSDGRLLLALFDKNRALALKRVLAEQFEDLGGSLSAIEGPDGSTLIAGRNQAALDVLRKQIAAGKRKLAVFYGAGHMEDFEKRLGDDFGLVPQSTRWLAAWNLQ